MADKKLSAFQKVNDFLYRNRKYMVVAYIVATVVFFSLEFGFLMNWDMLVRIMNANYLFHGGQYFEDQRALLESFLIGIFSFVLGPYAVYAFIALATVIFFVAVYYFSKSFGIDSVLTLGVVFNPFFLFYAIRNGSELPMYAFLILFIAMIKAKKPQYAGIFMALAFVSKYDSLFLLPLALFLVDWNAVGSLKRLGVFAASALLALVPFFAYNLALYHNIFFTFASSFYQNSATLAGTFSSGSGYIATGFEELVVLIPLAAMVLLLKKRKTSLLKSRKSDVLILLSALFLFFVIYILVSHMFSAGLNYFRFFLPVTLFATLILSLFLDKRMVLLTLLFFVVSMVLAYQILYSQPFNSSVLGGQISAAKSLLYSAYNTTNCTVQSNNWVFLDYYGISATYPRGENYSQYPIIGFGPLGASAASMVGGNYTLKGEKDGIFLYGYGVSDTACRYTPVVDLEYGVNSDISQSSANDTIACHLIYSKLRLSAVLDACIGVTDVLH